MKIMTFNVKNDMKKVTDEKVREIIEFLQKENPDVIGFQELTFSLKEKLAKELKDYTFYGRSRYGINTFFDEYNSLLVKKNIEIIETATYSLGKNPYKVASAKLGSIARICTMVTCIYNKKKIKIVNTHLENKKSNIKIFQLEVLYELLKNNNYPLILIGDFNMISENKNLISFIKKMNLIDTCKNEGKTRDETEANSPIDHILIDSSLKVYKAKKISDISVSDHYPLICEINF